MKLKEENKKYKIQKNKMEKILKYAIVMLLIFTVIQNIYLVMKIPSPQQVQISGKSTGEGQISLCFNFQPQINNTCNMTVLEHQNYSCKINATDLNPNTTLVFSSFFTSGPALFTTYPNGWMNFTPNETQDGNYTFQVYVTDHSECDNNNDTKIFNLTVLEVNDYPYLYRPLPNVSFAKSTTISAFFLNDYFRDPENLPMSYTYVASGAGITITILNTSEVFLYSDQCADINVIFTAIDYGGLTNNSNRINLKVICPPAIEPPSPPGGAGAPPIECTPDWKCYKYGPCLENNTKIRYCIDRKVCDILSYNYSISAPCDYINETLACRENWQCDDWGTCFNNTQKRTCVDLNDCLLKKNRPNETQNCTIVPSCFNGIKDGNETGVDCGGNCKSCSLFEFPAALIGGRNVFAYVVSFIIVLLLTTYVVYKYYNKQINSFLDNLRKAMAARKARPKLITESVKLSLIKKLDVLEGKLDGKIEKGKMESIVSEFSAIMRNYFKNALNVNIAFTKDELSENLKNRSINPKLSIILSHVFDKLEEIETGKNIPIKAEMAMLIDESKNLIYSTSTFTDDDALNTEKERAVEGDAKEKIYCILSNIHLSLIFKEINVAKKQYIYATEDYSELERKDKEAMYSTLLRAFEMIKYLE